MGKEKITTIGLRKSFRGLSVVRLSSLLAVCFFLFFVCSSPVFAAMLVNKTSGNWSNPGIWNLGEVPTTGDDVQIAPGTTVTYDVNSEVDINSVTVDGALIFSQSKNTNLDTGRLIVMEDGYLEIGTEANPLPANLQARIRLTENAVGGATHEEMMQGAFMVHGGLAHLHGTPKTPTFAELAVTAQTGQNTISLMVSPTGWKAGDQLILGGTKGRSEVATIASISGTTITLSSPLTFSHPAYTYTTIDAKKWEFRSHVGNLTRNILIESKYPNIARGHTMIMNDDENPYNPNKAEWYISYVAYKNLGGMADFACCTSPKPIKGRYAVHIHKLGTISNVVGENLDITNTQYIIGASMIYTQNSSLVIHSTDRFLVKDNVSYNTLAHSFFIDEDGDSGENKVVHNFVVLAQPAENIRRRDDFNRKATGIWFGNMNQVVEKNAVSDCGRGYGMYKIRPTPPNRLLGNKVVEPNQIPFRRFVDNEAYGVGLGVDIYHFVGFPTPQVVQGLKVWSSDQGFDISTGQNKEGMLTNLTWNNVVMANIESRAAEMKPGQTLKDSWIISRVSGDFTKRGRYGASITNHTKILNTIIESVKRYGIIASDNIGSDNIVQNSKLLVTDAQPFFLNPSSAPEGSGIDVFNYQGSRADLPTNFRLVPSILPNPGGCTLDTPMQAWICPLP